MINKKIIFYIFVLTVLLFTKLFSNEFNIEASKIEILKEGNVLVGDGGVKISTNDKIKIFSEKVFYDKVNQNLKIINNVKINDEINKLTILSSEIHYQKKQNKIFSDKASKALIDEKYIILIDEFEYDTLNKIIYSNKSSIITDIFGNKMITKKFIYFVKDKIIRVQNVVHTDNKKNIYKFKDAMINLDSKEILVKEISGDLYNENSINLKNQPRFKANSAEINENIKIFNKAIFTNCKKRDKCPPWVMSAETITHDVEKQTINYKNAWLKVYDYPVFYFPKFFHPDPTVKRQSGFLVPKFNDSQVFGMSLSTPYYYAISENKDTTFTPKFYSDKSFLIQNEYRQVNEKSSHIVDFSFNDAKGFSLSKNDSLRSHFFSNSKFNLDSKFFDFSELNLNLEKVSNDTYLKSYKIDSPIINDKTTLNSELNYFATNDDLSIEFSTEMYEDLSKENNRYEYIYPNFSINKDLDINNIDGALSFETSGFHKNYNSNIYETLVINDLLYNSPTSFLNNGFENNYNFLIKNVNSNSTNSSKYKKNENYEILSNFEFKSALPLIKKDKNYSNYLTPILSYRYGLGKSKNLINDDRRIDVKNIFAFDRIGAKETVESGQSLTFGTEFSKLNNDNKEVLSLDLATQFRKDTNHDLPSNSTIRNKSSDIVGNLNINPNDILNFSYDFSLDNGLNETNYNLIKSEIKINNFVTTFDFLEEKNFIGSDSYIANRTQYNFDNQNSISFGTRKNKKTDLTEFYNLIYQYQNDCLAASIEYNKEYYSDSDLKPDEQIFFAITIMPFGKNRSPNFNK
jgi:LPS-assembly protein